MLALADSNVTNRVSDALGLAPPAATSIHRSQEARASPSISGARMDFRSLGRILHAMLIGDVALLPGPHDAALTEKIVDATRLPLPLSPLQPCLDGLLGIGSARPVERAEDVLVELLGLKEVFPFDIRQAGTGGGPHSRERRRQ